MVKLDNVTENVLDVINDQMCIRDSLNRSLLYYNLDMIIFNSYFSLHFL